MKRGTIKRTMSSDQRFVDHVCEQAGLGSLLSSRKMFGEYALYVDGKVVALVCDNKVFIKPTVEGRQLLGPLGPERELPPYPGAKPHLLLGDELDDADMLQRLFTATARALPASKPKIKTTTRPKRA